MSKYLAFIFLILYSFTSFAAEAPIHFQIIPEQSSIKFQATQAGTPVSGEFRLFNSDIYFSPDALSKSRVETVIEMTSLSIDDPEAKNMLKDSNWFNIKAFPQAVFESTGFKHLGGKQYEVSGNLTIKGHSEPIEIVFTLDEFNKDYASITGSTTLRRTSYNIGEQDTSSIQDEVKVSLVIKANAIK